MIEKTPIALRRAAVSARRCCVALLFGLAAFGAAVWGYSTIAVGTAKAAYFYCNEAVPAYSFCPIYANINNDYYNTNQAYAKDINGYPVCERATIRYHAANVSYRCGGSPVDSGSDLWGYPLITTFSVYTGNNSAGSVYMVGKAYYVVIEVANDASHISSSGAIGDHVRTR